MPDKKPRVTEENKIVLFWESEVRKNPDGSVSLTAVTPQAHMSRKQAAKALGCSEWTVSDLFRLGFLTGHKPGAIAVRSDGRASNAKLRLDSASVLAYKQRGETAAKEWQDAQ